MYSREPNFVHVLLIIVWRAEEVLPEENPALVYGDCMPDNS
jgi:hypothetical protein